MKSARRFTFESRHFDLQSLRAEFRYTTEFEDGGREEYLETFDFRVEGFTPVVTEAKVLQPFLQALHLILGVSYWKLYCAPEINLKNDELTVEQAAFWGTTYTKGLGEFFYSNKIDYRDLAFFPSTLNVQEKLPEFAKTGKTLLPFGGGKDSIVAALMLREKGIAFDLFQLNDSLVQREAAEPFHAERLVVRRTIDRKLIQHATDQTAYSGHVPMTAIYSFAALFAAALYGYDTIAFSNEKSASYGNLQYLGHEINHQWSKSEEYENLLKHYVETSLSPSILVTSILRPYYELELVRRFVQHPEFFGKFSSCNTNFSSKADAGKTKKWCGECPKCAFMFVALAAFLPKEQVIKIIGSDLFAKSELVETYRALLGLGKPKPFECVGTSEETRLAFAMAHRTDEYAGEPAMVMFEQEALPEIGDLEKLESTVLSQVR